MSATGEGEPCYYCRRRLDHPRSRSRLRATRDHVKPRFQGGTQWVWSCWACNHVKGCMTRQQWATFRAAVPDWWKRRELENGSALRRLLMEVMG